MEDSQRASPPRRAADGAEPAAGGTERDGREGGGAEGPGPSPEETDALAWAAINEAAQRRRCPGARGLGRFLSDIAHAHVTPKGDPRTNIVDQGPRVTYALGRDHLRALFGHLEACRLEGSVCHFSERQGTPAEPRSGIRLDYDIDTTLRRPALTDRHCYRLAGALLGALQRDIDFAAGLPPRPGGARPTEARFHVFFTVKPEAVPVAADPPAGAAPAAPGAAPLYRYGFHIRVPGVKLSRPYKKWLLRQFRGDPAVAATLRELGAVGDPAACLDPNSASGPVLFFGSCKRGGAPYGLGAALEVTLDLGLEGEGGAGAGAGAGWTPPPVIQRLGPAELQGFNLAAELGLVAEADYEDGREPLVRKLEFEPRPAVAEQARDWAERTQGDALPVDELLLAEHSLSTLTLHDAEARHLHALLGLLGPEYSEDRNKWRDVVFALANTSEQYKPLAAWFSQRCPRKWDEGGLDALWADALARRGAVDHPLTVGSLKRWAQLSSPDRYAEVMERSYFTIATGYVYAHGGRLQHYMVAKILHVMLEALFCVDVEEGPRGGKAYNWYQFVVPGAAMVPGEVWKWRREAEPDDVHIYMSERLTRVLDQIGEHIDEKRERAADEAQAKYYAQLGKAFAASKDRLYDHTFKARVISQANFLFRRRGFAARLDRAPLLLGVANGVLRLGPRLALIDHYHEHPVSLYTPVAWRPFDPADPWQQLALGAIADIIVEPDARDWILFHAAQGLSGEEKEGAFLLWEGGGQNGKTSFLRWVARTLGPKAAKFNIQLMCCEREDADRPNSAMMRFEHLNYAYAEESNRAQVLNVARMKEMVNAGEVSGRDLNSRQKEFTMRANLVAASQYSFIVPSTDHGTWRRIFHYTSKARFRKRPDPACPFEKKEDQRFVRVYPSDPQFQSAVLAILGHYYERLQREHGGELKNVRAPTIERESEAFRISQDTLHRWICETIVDSPGCETEYPLGVLGGYYTEWYTAHIDRKRHVASDVIKDIESSALQKYLRPAPNRTFVLRGCRVLSAADNRLRPGEAFLSDAELRRGRSAGDWDASGDGAPHRADGLPWWAAREPAREPAHAPAPAPPRAGAGGDGSDGDDGDEWLGALVGDEALLAEERGGARRPALAPEALAEPLSDGDIDALLAEEWVACGRGPPDSYGIEDVYG